MKILYSKIENGEFKFTNQKEKEEYLEKNKNYKGLFCHAITKTTHERTSPQNRAMHKWFTQIADLLNGAGYNVQIVLAKKIDVDWTPNLVKEILWRTAQQAILKKDSTTKLEKVGEIELVQDHLIRHLGEKFGVTLPPFPHDPNKLST
jgi:hypothetical protein